MTVYEAIDFIVGINFKNSDGENKFNIITGDYKGKTINTLSSFDSDDDLIAYTISLESTIKVAFNGSENPEIDFFEIKNNLFKTGTFYEFNIFQKLVPIDDKKNIEKLQKEKRQKINEEVQDTSLEQVDRYIRDIKNDIEKIANLKYA